MRHVIISIWRFNIHEKIKQYPVNLHSDRNELSENMRMMRTVIDMENRRHIPVQNIQAEIPNAPQKLSKIETIRLACNYISVMSQTLNEGKSMDIERYLHTLSKDLSQATANLLANSVPENNTITASSPTVASSSYAVDFYNNYWWNQEYERYANWKNYTYDTYYQQLNFNHFNPNVNSIHNNSISEFNFNYS